ncbi:MAG: enoyl-CoA hydratase-related protein [Gammaproteobacteria bacterium]|nr:enoyl-CoA hydratase-related protein [Gammaproteobacteria bacterium]
MYEKYQHLKLARRGKVLTMTLDNPPLNAIGQGIHDELMTIFPDIAQDHEVNVVVITGRGRAFSAGGDLQLVADNMDDANAYLAKAISPYTYLIAYGMINLDKVIIAKINGDTFGVGATVALLSDLSIAVPHAKIADPHVVMGISAGDGGSYLWPLNIGFAKAKWHLLTGEALTGEEAEQMGLISKVVPADELDAFVDALAEKLANGPSMALNATKRSVNMLLKRQIEGLVEAHWGMEVFTLFSEDHRSAVRGFMDGEKPEFKGR